MEGFHKCNSVSTTIGLTEDIVSIINYIQELNMKNSHAYALEIVESKCDVFLCNRVAAMLLNCAG